MSDRPPSKAEARHRAYLQKLASDEQRKLRSKKSPPGKILSGFTLFGLIGWTIAVPTVLAALLGAWLDQHYPSDRSWTLALLVAGLTFGCFNAWRWMSEEDVRINAPEGKDDD